MNITNTQGVYAYPDLAARFAAAQDTYANSIDGGLDRRAYYTERDAIFDEAARRDAAAAALAERTARRQRFIDSMRGR